MFQTHYDNRGLERDVTVEWGMNIYYTEKLRSVVSLEVILRRERAKKATGIV